ncbi:MAG: hypothetical protein COT73_11040 [Bdellovibrio sp. CG10_big_fil_rev_8_21_14_0_10_47_8]|nr:MAG: hypothetical protein COT73_11040 [Bdellovibrio sp. CG10_big_fil_rev_8_21_14_0_10_47_8]
MKIQAWILIILMSFGQMSLGQTTSTTSSGLRKGLATVMFAGLAGAVLGLSTLSFYGEPQEHIGNIWTGLAIGTIAGSVYVFSQKSRSFADQEIQQWPQNPHQIKKQNRPLWAYQWEF